MYLPRLDGDDPGRPAIVMASDGRTVTFGELERRTRALSRVLAEQGIGRGDHIAILMDNRPEFLETAWAAQRSGIYYTPVNWHLTEAEAAYVVDDCGARALFASAAVGDLAALVLAASPRVELALMAGGARGGFRDYEAEIGRVAAGLDVAGPDAAAGSGAEDGAGNGAGEVEGTYFFYSSGTTGRPKGIQPVHEFPPFGTGLPLDYGLAGLFGFNASSVYLCPAPLYHSAPLGFSVATQRNGGTVVVMERFDALECLRAIERYRITHAQFVPTHFVRMLKLSDDERACADVSTLRVVVHAAAPCPVDVKQQMIDWLGPTLVEYYAGSEGAGMTVISSADWLAHKGSVGRPAGGAVHIVGEDGEELPGGEIGTVYFEGGSGFRYHNDEAKTAAAYNDRGWATLGDLGYLDEDGYLYLADRRTDLIISGGVNIYPAEIEDALIMHPAVADVAVIGVPNGEMGESVHAVVQLAPGSAAGDEMTEVLSVFARQRLAGFKIPRSFSFTTQLPRLPTGKLLRRRVREEHSA